MDPETIREITPEMDPETMQGIAPEMALETIQGITPEMALETIPEMALEEIREIVLEEVPDILREVQAYMGMHIRMLEKEKAADGRNFQQDGYFITQMEERRKMNGVIFIMV